MMWMGESILGYGRVLDPAAIERKLLAVTPEDVRAVASTCLHPRRLGVAVVGPVQDAAQIRGWLGSK